MDSKEYSSKYYKSQLYDLYKEIQNEIKDKVISKLLLKVQTMYKELTDLKTENTSLKIIYHIYLKELFFIKMNIILLIFLIIVLFLIIIKIIIQIQLA